MRREATTAHPVHELISRRWSPYGFDRRPVATADLLSLFEAARWAPSSYNEQPWHYIVATQDDPDEFDRLLSCLVEGNQGWAKTAPVLAISVKAVGFARNGKPNPAADHDLGLAAATLTFEASARGIGVHQMIGILPDKVRELYGVPDDFEPLTGLAIGYPADPRDMPEELRKREENSRIRKVLGKFIFGGQWGTTSKLVS